MALSRLTSLARLQSTAQRRNQKNRFGRRFGLALFPRNGFPLRSDLDTSQDRLEQVDFNIFLSMHTSVACSTACASEEIYSPPFKVVRLVFFLP